MGLDAPQQPHAAPPAGQQEPSARAGDDRHQSADMVIKAGGIHSMAEPREAGAGQVRGILGPGRLAAYPADPLSCSLDELAGLGPVLTVIGGRTRYDPHRLTPGGDTPPGTGAPS
jgi:hypothetical protein